MLDVVCVGAGSIVVGVLTTDTSGGGSGLADGIIGTVCRASGTGITPILMIAFSVGRWEA